MNYPETYGTPDTSHRTKTKSQHRKIKRWKTRTPLPKQKNDEKHGPPSKNKKTISSTDLPPKTNNNEQHGPTLKTNKKD